MAKKDIEEEIREFLQLWPAQQMIDFLRDIIPLFELFDVDDENDWVLEEVGEDNEQNVRLVRFIYLVSRIAEKHTGRLARVKSSHPKLCNRLEEIAKQFK